MDKPSGDNKCIGVLGFLAVIGIMGWHYARHFDGTPLSTIMAPCYRYGLLLVDYLFVLAGFLAAESMSRPRADSGRRLVTFTLARLYPLHLVTLCVVALMQWHLTHDLGQAPFIYHDNDAYHFVLNLLLLNRTGFDHGMSFNGPASFVSTIFVVVALFAACRAAGHRLSRLLDILLFAIALLVAYHYGLLSNAPVFGWVDADIFRTLLGFLVGVATFKLHRSLLMRSWLAWCGDLLAALAAGIVVLYLAQWKTGNAADIALVLVAYPALTLGVLHGKWWRAVMAHRLVAWAGGLAIPMYLIHFPLQLATQVGAAQWGWHPPYGRPSFLLAFVVATIALSWISRSCLEMPAMRLWLGRRASMGSEPVLNAASKH